MIEENQEVDPQLSLSFAENEKLSPITPLQAPFPHPLSSSSLTSNQKIEIVFAQGHRLCLQGSFDWDELRSWLTPLLIGEE